MTFLKRILAICSFICSIVIGFIAMFLPPKGIIDTSILWFIAQMLVFAANILGFNFNVFKSDKVI